MDDIVQTIDSSKKEVKALVEKAQNNQLECQPGRTMIESFENNEDIHAHACGDYVLAQLQGGVSPQAVVEASRPRLAITHAPGCMFVCDTPNEALAADAGLDAFA